MNAPTPQPSDILSALLTDQQRRWSDGHCPKVEEYLAQHPDLADDRQGLFALIFAEVSLRQARGETPVLREYQARFPSHAETLGLHWGAVAAGMPAGGGIHSDVTDVDLRPATTLPHLPGYEVLGEIGRGGMGVAYRARHLGLGREVCVKVLYADRGRGREEMARFATEALAVGRLDHPGVVRVHDTGACDGVPFLVMELITGGSLADALKAGPLSAERAARLMMDVARAVQAVHDARIVHRDLKPGNILLTEDGAPKVADFGLAKLLEAGGDLTGSERAMGTPQYMAPEQASGHTREAGPAADVWALGATLYACLTGRPPFRGRTPLQILARVREANPPPPRSVRSDVPPGLEAVCLKCLEKRPEDRPGSAGEVADELQRWLNGEGVRTPPRGLARRAIGWARRHPRRAFLAAAVGAVPAAAVGGFWAWGVDWLDEELKRGKGAELFDARGMPRHFRIVAGAHSGHRVPGDDQAFTVQAESPALVELARSPCRDAFRYQCQVRHLRSREAVFVGLYFAHRVYSIAGRQVHVYAELSFNDIIRTKGPRMNGKALKNPARRNPLRLGLTAYAATGWTDDGLVASVPFAAEVIEAHGDENAPWRTIAVELAGEKVRILWSPNCEDPPIEVGTCHATKMLKSIDAAFKRLPANHPARAIEPTYDPRGGIGVVVHRGAASFRAAVISL